MATAVDGGNGKNSGKASTFEYFGAVGGQLAPLEGTFPEAAIAQVRAVQGQRKSVQLGCLQHAFGQIIS